MEKIKEAIEKTMKQIIIFLILLIVGCGCSRSYKQMPRTEYPPFIVVAKGVGERTGTKAIVLKDANNVYYNLEGGYYNTIAIYDSYEIGDTII